MSQSPNNGNKGRIRILTPAEREKLKHWVLTRTCAEYGLDKYGNPMLRPANLLRPKPPGEQM